MTNAFGFVGAHTTLANGSTLNVRGTFANASYAWPDYSGVHISGGSTMNVGGDFDNIGSIDSGGYVELTGRSSLNVQGDLNSTGHIVSLSGASTLIVQKDLNISQDGAAYIPSLSLADGSAAIVQGTVNNAGAQVQVDNTSVLTAASGYVQTEGSTLVDGLLSAGGEGVDIRGGTLSGSGTITGDVIMSGTLNPGDSAGTLTINGNYIQTASGILNEEIGGTGLSQYDQTVVAGMANLAGTLYIILINGFTPNVGDRFVIMTYDCFLGGFSTVNGLDIGNGLLFDLIYGPHDITLIAESSVPPTVPEPSTLLLLGAGLLSVLGYGRRKGSSRMLR
jgi:hypothetical protein